MSIKLYYIHDPMCSWCWGYAPTWQSLQEHLPPNIAVEYVAGGLAPDSIDPMPSDLQQIIQQHWRNIQSKLGTKFNFDFWTNNTPKRSTYNACRAVIAANLQGYQQAMVLLIQEAYYLRALNPSEPSVLISLASELADNSQRGITNNLATAQFNDEAFVEDFTSIEVNAELMRQVQLAISLSQQGFPSLVLEVQGSFQQINIDYKNFAVTLASIEAYINKKS